MQNGQMMLNTSTFTIGIPDELLSPSMNYLSCCLNSFGANNIIGITR